MGGCTHIYSAMANAAAPDAADPAAAALGQNLGAANAVGLADDPLQWQMPAAGGQAAGGGALAADAADAAGAQPSEGYETTTESLDIATRTWSRQAPMPQARRAFAADVLKDGRVIVAGGATHHDVFLKSVFAFNPRSGKLPRITVGIWVALFPRVPAISRADRNLGGAGIHAVMPLLLLRQRDWRRPLHHRRRVFGAGGRGGGASRLALFVLGLRAEGQLVEHAAIDAHAAGGPRHRRSRLLAVRGARRPPRFCWRHESVSDEPFVLRWAVSIGRTRAVFGPWKCWTPRRSAGTGCPT